MKKLQTFLLTLLLVAGAPVRSLAADTPERQELSQLNMLAKFNAGFENGKGKWTASSSPTFTLANSGSNLFEGASSGLFDASAGAQTLCSSLIPVAKFKNGAASLWALTAATDYKLQVRDGSAVVLSEVLIPPSSSYIPVSLSFLMPASGSVRTCVVSQSNAAVVALDKVFMGKNDLIAISQASIYGTAHWAPTSNCEWATANGLPITALPADSDCPDPTVSGGLSAPATKIPAVVANSLPPGDYEVEFSGTYTAKSGTNCVFGVVDENGVAGTNGTVGGSSTTTTNYQGGVIKARFTYTTPGNHTFQVFGSDTAASTTCSIGNDSGDASTFTVKRFPLASEQAIRPDQSANSWSGYQTVASGWSTGSSSFADPSAGVTVALVELTNRNFGTVTSMAGDLPGITWTANSAGRYWVCGAPTITTSAANAGAQLLDGSNNIIHAGSSAYQSASAEISPTLCGIQNVAAVGSVSTKLRVATSGTATISGTNVASPNAAINWSIVKIDQALPAPVIVGAVVTPSAGVTQLLSVFFAGDAGGTVACTSDPCTIVRQSGGVSSVNRTSAGLYTVNISAGTFSVPPICTVSGHDVVTPTLSGGNGTANTTTAVGFYITNNLNAAQDEAVSVLCMGPK